jgi:serine/threonine protein kinase
MQTTGRYNIEGVFPASTAQYYAACVTLMLEKLHSMNILYRDLKPENLLLNGQGVLKMVDFGMAKKVTGRTYTLCGTPEYMAPEVIHSVGHGRGVDYWALGVLVFEMICGDSPFEDPNNNHLNVCVCACVRAAGTSKCNEGACMVIPYAVPSLPCAPLCAPRCSPRKCHALSNCCPFDTSSFVVATRLSL